MLSSLYSGVSGITAAGYTMSVIGNNIANSNTIGFKSNYTSFADILSQSLGGAVGGSQVGRGVSLTEISTQFSQGSFENTTNGTDLAIEGPGFFLVSDESGMFYTRAGQFIMDSEGYLVNPSSFKLQGYGIDVDGNLLTKIGDLNISMVSSAPKQTESFSIGANLDGGAEDGTQYNTTITVYDSIGEAIPLTVTFTKLDTGNEWAYSVSMPEGTGTATGDGTITFDTDGNLVSLDGTTGFTDKEIFIDLPGTGGGDFTVTWDLWDETLIVPNQDITGYSANSYTHNLLQDGYAPGSVQAVSVDEEGKIIGLFDNGQTRVLGQVVVADFSSPWGLTKMGKNLFAESSGSGSPIVGTPGSGGLGKIAANSLEMSNVDMASEFVKMITTQRAYQANSKVISTSDEMLSELMRIKR